MTGIFVCLFVSLSFSRGTILLSTVFNTSMSKLINCQSDVYMSLYFAKAYAYYDLLSLILNKYLEYKN